MQDILRTIKFLNTKLYYKIQHIYFLEKSKTLKSYLKRINKSKIILDINQIEKKETFILANGFFDAIPVNQYIKIGKFWHERKVYLDDKSKFSFIISKSPVTKKIPFPPSTIQNIDSAMMEYMLETLSIFTSTNKGWSKVPVLWSSADRAFQSK